MHDLMEINEVNLVLHSAVEKAENVAQKLRLCTHQVINGHGEPVYHHLNCHPQLW